VTGARGWAAWTVERDDGTEFQSTAVAPYGGGNALDAHQCMAITSVNVYARCGYRFQQGGGAAQAEDAMARSSPWATSIARFNA